MTNIMDGVKRLSAPMFVIFVLSKVLVGIGIGILLIRYLYQYGWWFLIAGIALSLICLIIAAKNK